MAEKRKYELKKRGDQVERTRRRITEAAVELHRTVGPAATSVSDVARLAGVQRPTVYKHFPDAAALFGACSAHWRGLHPAPDPGAWTAIPDPGQRLRAGLRELYAWYRETEPMTANVLRDMQALPALGTIVEQGLAAHATSVRSVLSLGFPRRKTVRAAVAAAVDFHLWRTLTRAGLSDGEAAELGARFVEAA